MRAMELGSRLRSRLYQHVVDAWQDWRLGIDASGLYWPNELTLTELKRAEPVEYFGTPTIVLNRALNRLGVDPSQFAFVDLGSGKGRVVLHAATRPFRRVVGVELSQTVHAIALKNIANATARGYIRAPVALENKNVLDYELPEERLVLYQFNAFGAGVLDKLVDGLEESLLAHPRECYFIYVNPQHRHCLDKRTFLKEVPPARGLSFLDRLISPWPVVIYETCNPDTVV